jgi:hypothetical protein
MFTLPIFLWSTLVTWPSPKSGVGEDILHFVGRTARSQKVKSINTKATIWRQGKAQWLPRDGGGWVKTE